MEGKPMVISDIGDFLRGALPRLQEDASANMTGIITYGNLFILDPSTHYRSPSQTESNIRCPQSDDRYKLITNRYRNGGLSILINGQLSTVNHLEFRPTASASGAPS
jgi:hypothetical protein